MVPQPLPGARVALSAVRVCPPRRQPCRNPSTTRHLTTTRRPRDARPLAAEQRSASHDRRTYATASPTHPKNIAVLGGGLTGLSTAWFLAKYMPKAKITIYEGSGRMGGWIDSETVEVTAADGTKGTVVFERGARLVQPKTGVQSWDDVAFLELFVDLQTELSKSGTWNGLESYDRYFYYPDHLVRLPNIPGASDPVGTIGAFAGLAIDAMTEPIYEGMPSFLWNMVRGRGGQATSDDVSIGDEFLRRGGRREPVDNMFSAMCHGIYGGDVWKLSAHSSIFGPAYMNQRLAVEYTEPRKRWTNPGVLVPLQDQELVREAGFTNEDVLTLVGKSKAYKSYNFHKGFGVLTDTLVAKLKANPNVTFVNEKVAKVRLSATGRMEVTTAKRALQYDKVISSLYSKALASLAPRNSLPSLAKSTAVTIRLVNLWSPTPNLNHGTKGFGYLLPQTVPAEQNPHAALGVIFDSDRTARKADDLSPSEPAHRHQPCEGDTVPGTKFTVMLGGHYWDDIPPRFLPAAATDDDAAIAAAKETLHIQMGIDPAHWQVAGTKLCVDCIPQHLVGHYKRMGAAHRELRTAFKGKLAVVGGSYTAPGVVGSVRAARDVAWQVSDGFRGYMKMEKRSGGEVVFKHEPTEDGKEVEWTVGDTGLVRFDGGPARLWTPDEAIPLKKIRDGSWRGRGGVD